MVDICFESVYIHNIRNEKELLLMQNIRWNSINSAPQNTKEMFIVRAFNATQGLNRSYTSDPVATWAVDGEFPRWKHDFAPTHWCELPVFEETE